MSGELTVALKKGIRKKAKKALREKSAIERLRKSAKNGEEVKQLDEVVEHLEEVAEKARNTGKLTIKNEGAISLSKFNKIAKRIKSEYDVDMFLIDRNNKQWKELFKKWQDNPLDGMWTDQPLMSKNYPGLQLDGPAIYLFNGVTKKGVYNVTSYTVQHELFHMKMWLIIKERFPKTYIKKFHQITDEIHEAYVISEFVKIKQFTKWSNTDILNDIDAFNENFNKKMKLGDFKNFNLEKYLQKI